MMRNHRLTGIIVLVLFLITIFCPVSAQAATDKTVLSEIADLLEHNYVDPVTDKVLKAPSVTLMLKALGDPYATYYTKKQFEQELEQLNGSFTGVGFYFNPGKEGAEVMALLPDSPAQKAGVRVGDMVLEAGGHSLAGLNKDQIAEFIRGPVGSSVILKIKRGAQIIEYKITRQQINLPSVEKTMIGKDIGDIELLEFGARSSEEMASAITDLKRQDAKYWILDMRDNPGGYLETALGVAGFFIGNQDTVIVKERNAQEKYPGDFSKEYVDGPLIVLANENSASAAEIVTAALKDQQRALIIGHKTYGKGTVQQIFELSNGDRIKFTVARFYSPLDKPINGVGITPDIEVSDENALKAAELFLYDIPQSYTGSLIKIDTDVFSIGVDPVIARSGEYWSAWTEIVKGCAAYPISYGNEKDGWTEFSKEERAAKWGLYYPGYQYQGELAYKIGQAGLQLDFLTDVKASYLNDSNIQLIKAATGEHIPVKYAVDANKGVSLSPTKTIDPGEYWLVVDNRFLRFNDGHPLDKNLLARIIVSK